MEPEQVGAELLWVEPEPIFLTWRRSQKKNYLEPEPRKNGSAPQHCCTGTWWNQRGEGLGRWWSDCTAQDLFYSWLSTSNGKYCNNNLKIEQRISVTFTVYLVVYNKKTERINQCCESGANWIQNLSWIQIRNYLIQTRIWNYLFVPDLESWSWIRIRNKSFRIHNIAIHVLSGRDWLNGVGTEFSLVLLLYWRID